MSARDIPQTGSDKQPKKLPSLHLTRPTRKSKESVQHALALPTTYKKELQMQMGSSEHRPHLPSHQQPMRKTKACSRLVKMETTECEITEVFKIGTASTDSAADLLFGSNSEKRKTSLPPTALLLPQLRGTIKATPNSPDPVRLALTDTPKRGPKDKLLDQELSKADSLHHTERRAVQETLEALRTDNSLDKELFSEKDKPKLIEYLHEHAKPITLSRRQGRSHPVQHTPEVIISLVKLNFVKPKIPQELLQATTETTTSNRGTNLFSLSWSRLSTTGKTTDEVANELATQLKDALLEESLHQKAKTLIEDIPDESTAHPEDAIVSPESLNLMLADTLTNLLLASEISKQNAAKTLNKIRTLVVATEHESTQKVINCVDRLKQTYFPIPKEKSSEPYQLHALHKSLDRLQSTVQRKEDQELRAAATAIKEKPGRQETIPKSKPTSRLKPHPPTEQRTFNPRRPDGERPKTNRRARSIRREVPLEDVRPK